MVTVNIIISRHGETDSNSKDLLQGCAVDDDLNAQGLQQAQQLAERLKDEKIDWIITSPLVRAMHTAQIVKGYHENAEITKDHRLIAMSWGVLDGTSIKKCYEIRSAVKTQWKNGNMEAKVTDGESINDCQVRITEAFTDILTVAERNNYKCIYVCTHGSLVCTILASLIDKNLANMDQYRHTNCGYYQFQVDLDPKVFARDGVDGLVFEHIRMDVRDHLKVAN